MLDTGLPGLALNYTEQNLYAPAKFNKSFTLTADSQPRFNGMYKEQSC